MKKRIAITILAMALIQMGTNAVAPILSDIMSAFPGTSAQQVQFLMTFPCIFVVVFCMLSSYLASYVSKKILSSVGCLLVCLGGLFAVTYHASIGWLLLWAALIGIGIGLVVPISTTLISDYFSGEDRIKMMGMQTSAVNIGSIIMSYVSGLLALKAWQYSYYVYLIALPGFILCLINLPNKRSDSMPDKQIAPKKLSNKTLLCCICAFVGALVFNVIPANLSMLIAERSIGNSSLAGTALAVYLLGGCIAGALFSKIRKTLGKNVISAGFCLLVIGIVICCFSKSAMVLLIGSFISGTSLSLIMPECMYQVSIEGNETTKSIATGLVMSSSNLGTFFLPVITIISNVFGKTVMPRLIVTILMSVIFVTLYEITIKQKLQN